jgi:hypothetical protein
MACSKIPPISLTMGGSYFFFFSSAISPPD